MASYMEEILHHLIPFIQSDWFGIQLWEFLQWKNPHTHPGAPCFHVCRGYLSPRVPQTRQRPPPAVGVEHLRAQPTNGIVLEGGGAWVRKKRILWGSVKGHQEIHSQAGSGQIGESSAYRTPDEIKKVR